MTQGKKPQVIFLDAVGTIFGVKNSVGFIYAQLADRYGIQGDAQLINQCFYEAFKEAPPLAFGKIKIEEIRKLEYIWWKKVAYLTFKKANLVDQFSNFTDFFLELYRHFKTAEPWYIYDDTIPFLNYWQQQNVNLAIISNFDTRIYLVLEELHLKSYFKTITISSLTGVAKPDARIFLSALEKHNCLPENAWYIGDSRREDYWGAKAVGMKAFWLNRTN